MVCIQCYLPPILFMIYMKFVHPILAPFILPVIERVIVYFRGPQALQSDGCPIRPKAKKTQPEQTPAGDSTESKAKNE